MKPACMIVVFEGDAMSDDLIARAEQIEFDHIAYRKTDCESRQWVKVGAFWYDEMVECIPLLIAEIKRLRSEAESDVCLGCLAKLEAISNAKELIVQKDARIAELEADVKMLDASVAVGLDRLTANAKEAVAILNDGVDLVKYIKRLEEAFLEAEFNRLYYSGHYQDPRMKENYQKRAHAALERIKNGE